MAVANVVHGARDIRTKISADPEIKRKGNRIALYSTDTACSRELGGTGLAIVKHLARLHRGEARVESTLGKGSIFTVELADV